MPEIAGTLLPLIAIVAVFWLLIIRPQQRRQKALQQLRSSLAPGDKVMLTSGIFGVLRTAEGDRATVEIAPGTVVELATGAIASVEKPQTAAPVDETDAPEAEDTGGVDRRAGDEER